VYKFTSESSDFKVTIFFNVEYVKKYFKTEQCFQWQTDKKSCMIYLVVPFSMTLNDLNPDFKAHHYSTLII